MVDGVAARPPRGAGGTQKDSFPSALVRRVPVLPSHSCSWSQALPPPLPPPSCLGVPGRGSARPRNWEEAVEEGW